VNAKENLALKENEQPEVADIFRLYGEGYRQYNPVSYEQRKAMHHIEVCRTAELGGHVEQCDQCSFERIAYNSCRDRHCPKCQTSTKEQWLNDRKSELLALTKELKALTQKVEKIFKALGKLEKPQAKPKPLKKTAKPKPVKKAAKPKKYVKKPAVKKTAKKPTENKAPKGSVTDAIMGVIQSSSEGVNTDQIMKQTGLNKRQVWGTITRAKREGKVKTVKWGIYVGV